FLTVVVCALSGGRMEEEYLAVSGRYASGEMGSRGMDLLSETFGHLVALMEETRADILGDLFAGGITYGEAGQFLTPENVTTMMARMIGSDGGTVSDACCGSGRMLLAAADENRSRLFVGQDVDL